MKKIKQDTLKLSLNFQQKVKNRVRGKKKYFTVRLVQKSSPIVGNGLDMKESAKNKR